MASSVSNPRQCHRINSTNTQKCEITSERLELTRAEKQECRTRISDPILLTNQPLPYEFAVVQYNHKTKYAARSEARSEILLTSQILGPFQ